MMFYHRISLLGHCGLVRQATLSVTPGDRRRRPLDLKAKRSEADQITQGADPESIFSKIEKSSISKVFCLVWKLNWIGIIEVERAAMAASRGHRERLRMTKHNT